ncbi:hypothetical protein J7E25_06000 [Agromyces sp. ISL-38]|uniref:hypothetical protein n=1 Tax=Agromyces sp. ISL-38 TaxID=2819107 RepID=UPI001BEB9835|nr:hypothetical protein [Agromyces sp. ISL-38]MBT2498642.1 hypothetical protein [Agromyces sp. ISL-38]MBT2518509.1 hypothetical protein [Streptomyces sp. ISL-90]
MSLRDELDRSPDLPPAWRIMLPAGWVERAPDAETEHELTAATAARMRAAHRPDLNAQLRRLTREAFDRMRSQDTIAFYHQVAAVEGQIMPISIIASRLASPMGGPLDDQVADLIRNHGAEPFDDARTMIRWSTSSTMESGGERIGLRAIGYLTPVPRTHRRAALQFTAAITHPVGLADDDPSLIKLEFVCDAIMGTFGWAQ